MAHRGRSAAARSIVAWFALTGVLAALLLSLPLFGIPDATGRFVFIGLTATRGAEGLALLASVAAAIIAIGLRDRLTALPWAGMQAVYGVLATVWTFGGVRARHEEFTFDVDSAWLGSRLDSLLSDLSNVAAATVVALGAGMAAVLLNASMQSLVGAVQARRFAPIAALSPAAAWYGDKAAVLCLLAAVGVLALSAMASERGRGLAWSTSLGLLSGLLLAAGALSGFAVLTASVGMLCIYFLRRRSLMILLGGAGVLIGLLGATALGWSWPDEIGAASVAALESYQLQASVVVMSGLIAVAVAGPPLVESGRKFRGTPGWPLMLTGALMLFVGVLTRSVDTSVLAAIAPALPLLSVGCVAPPRSGGVPDGPSLPVAVLGAVSAIAAVVMSLIVFRTPLA
ncbi:hypothetical protein EK0264_18730 [Epidermidibacterium keratini]|uniref:Uncharacterized protein n=1 Tax=Epidermidibacterium keratini TaxID=1891644 RepID=A0A7L4YS97_9ACTN|nr:hypothetical protein [Epidermidibacterium keratini]QHC02105.1 hypothetical protein EK0264_18730 [Epidermidibacterium keratini]